MSISRNLKLDILYLELPGKILMTMKCRFASCFLSITQPLSHFCLKDRKLYELFFHKDSETTMINAHNNVHAQIDNCDVHIAYACAVPDLT